MWEDPIVAEVRHVRDQLERQFNFDVAAVFADLRKRQASLGSRLVCRETGTKAAAPKPESGGVHPGR